MLLFHRGFLCILLPARQAVSEIWRDRNRREKPRTDPRKFVEQRFGRLRPHRVMGA